MCECCSAEADEYDHPIPGWVLVRASRKGRIMEKDQWGLTNGNDPCIIWTDTPVKDALAKLTDEQVNALPHDEYWKLEEAFDIPARRFEEALKLYPRDGHELWVACIEAGYKPKEDGRLALWLFDRLAHWIEGRVPTQNRPFSNLKTQQ